MNIKEKPELSVIVPIFNSELYLEKCLDSILNQTYTNFEVILVDDGSKDHSLDICRKYAQEDKRVRVISKRNGGLIRARKTGVAMAVGRFIGFVDSDDWIEPVMYEELIKCMKNTKCDLVSSGIIRDFESSGQKSVVVLDHYEEGIHQNLAKTIYPTMLFSENYHNFGLYCTLVNKIYRKEILKRIYADINEDVFYGEDALTCNPYCLLSESIFILHKAFYHYNIRTQSMASVSDKRLPYNNYLLYNGLQKAFLKSECSFVLMRQLKKYLMHLERHNLLTLYHFDVVALDEWHFSFSEELFDLRFVLYGAGACGQALFRKVCEMGKEQNMVLWVDKCAEKKAEECAYPISTPDAFMQKDWDVILISVQSENLAQKIKDELVDVYQIDQEKLIWNRIEHVPVWDIY